MASSSKQSRKKNQLSLSVCIFLATMSSQSKGLQHTSGFHCVQWQLSRRTTYVRSHTKSGQTKPVHLPNCKMVNFVSLQRKISKPSSAQSTSEKKVIQFSFVPVSQSTAKRSSVTPVEIQGKSVLHFGLK